MKQVGLDLLRHEADLYQNTTRIMKQVGFCLLTKSVKVTWIKNHLYQDFSVGLVLFSIVSPSMFNQTMRPPEARLISMIYSVFV